MFVRLCSVVVLVCARLISADNGAAYFSNEPYDIIWQSPSEVCQNEDLNVPFIDDLAKAGITFNVNDGWYGDRSVFYNPFTYGAWPYYATGLPPAINGGLPQLGNIDQHISNALKAVLGRIPDTTFNGVAVIDMEEWRPLWERNWGWKSVYQNESVALVRKMNKGTNPTEAWIVAEANRQFTEAAKRYMTETLRSSKKLRPNALWGYYHYPECFNNKKPFVLHCKKTVQDGNDKLSWLWEESSALYPSLYIFKNTWSSNDAARYMYAIIDETVRLAKLVGGKPVLPYTKLKYDTTDPGADAYYSKTIMLMSLRMGADFGVEGTVIWGSDADYETVEGCNQNLNHLRTVIAPYTQKLFDFTKLCSKKRCSSVGRCVHRGALDDSFADEIIRDTDDKLQDWVIDERYMCRCNDGTVAKKCQKTG